jgi:hypothetical protein
VGEDREAAFFVGRDLDLAVVRGLAGDVRHPSK